MIGPKPKGLSHCGCSPWQMIKEQIQALYERVTVTEQRCNTLQAEIDEIEVGPGNHLLMIIPSLIAPVPGDTFCVWDGEVMNLGTAAKYIYDAIYDHRRPIDVWVATDEAGEAIDVYRLSTITDNRVSLMRTTLNFNHVTVQGKTSVTESLFTLEIEGNDLTLKHVTSVTLGTNEYP